MNPIYIQVAQCAHKFSNPCVSNSHTLLIASQYAWFRAFPDAGPVCWLVFVRVDVAVGAALCIWAAMGKIMSALKALAGREERRILMVGLDAAGKTTILSAVVY